MKTESQRAAIDRWKSGTNLAETQPVEAIEEFTKAIELNPSWLLPYFWRAMMHSDLKQYERAESDFSTFIQRYDGERDELLAEAHAGRALVHRGKGDFQQAIADYTQELDINPKSAQGHLGRSIVYDELGESELACADFDQSLQLDPTIAERVENRPAGWKRYREARGSTGTG